MVPRSLSAHLADAAGEMSGTKAANLETSRPFPWLKFIVQRRVHHQLVISILASSHLHHHPCLQNQDMRQSLWLPFSV
jgi:hypothetical protein